MWALSIARTNYRKYLAETMVRYHNTIYNLLDESPGAVFLDVGCGNGERTMECARRIKAERVIGIEVDEDRARLARKNGVDIMQQDLENGIPLPDASVDVLVAAGTILHMNDTHGFMSEMHRVLKPQGYAIVTALNLASFHHILALVMGYQPLVLVDMRLKKPVGNPLLQGDLLGSPHRKPGQNRARAFAYQALVELLQTYGFEIQRLTAVGYPPVPYPVSQLLAKLDPRHGYYLVTKVTKRV